MNEVFETAAINVEDLMSDKVNQRADRETYRVVDREEMERGEAYAEFRNVEATEEFDPVVHVDYSTASCDLCDTEGRYDKFGYIECRNCGLIMNPDDPLLLPMEDNDRLQNAVGTPTDADNASVGAFN